MTDYIERSNAIKAVCSKCRACIGKRTLDCGEARALQALPAADVRENVQGEWIEDDYGYNRCSECGYEFDYAEEKTPFCPGCGANMEVDNND